MILYFTEYLSLNRFNVYLVINEYAIFIYILYAYSKNRY